MKQKLISILITALVLLISYNSRCQINKLGAMFGTPTVGDSLMVIRGPVTSCSGSGLCSASPTPVAGSATITLAMSPSQLVASRVASYTLVMKIWKRGLNKTKKHKQDRKNFRHHTYIFNQSVRIPVKYISGKVPAGAKYAVIPSCTIFNVKNHFLGHFEMTITGVTFE